MNIAFFTDTYRPQVNGVAVALENTVTALRSRGHTVYVFAPEINGFKDRDPGVIRLRSFKILASDPDVFAPLLVPDKSYRKMLDIPFDLVHAHGNGAFSLLGHRVARMRGVPYILTFHTLLTQYTHYVFKGKIIRPNMVATAMRLFGNVCDGVIVPSRKMKREIERYGVQKRIEIIPNIIDLSQYGQARKGFLRKLCKIPSDQSIILTVGRLGKEKNFDFLIKTFRTVVKKHPIAHLVIVGHGIEYESLQNTIESCHLEKSVHLAGMVEQTRMPEVYQDADIFAFSSRTETQGLVVVEAAASGLPLVIADDEAYVEIVNKKDGFLLPHSQKQFAEKISLLLNDENLRRRMGEQAAQISRAHFDKDKLTDQLISYYQKTLHDFSSAQEENVLTRSSSRFFAYVSDIVERFFD